MLILYLFVESINIKILNAGAWARGSERVTVSLPLELEDYIPEVEDFYKKKHSGRKLQWYHHMSNGTVSKRCQTMYFIYNLCMFLLQFNCFMSPIQTVVCFIIKGLPESKGHFILPKKTSTLLKQFYFHNKFLIHFS